MKNTKPIIWLASAFIGVFVGYTYGVNLNGQPSYPSPSSTPVTQQVSGLRVGPDSIIKSQQVVALGEVTKVEQDKLTIKGEDGQEMSMALSSTFNVYPVSTDPKSPPLPSQDRLDIKLNQRAQIILELEGPQYKVVSISYLPN